MAFLKNRQEIRDYVSTSEQALDKDNKVQTDFPKIHFVGRKTEYLLGVEQEFIR